MWHPLETSDWFSGDLCDTCCFSDSFAAAILHHHRRKYPKSPRSPASTFPHSIQLLLDCLPSARLVSISPRGDYFCTFAHGKFLASPTRSNSATAVTSCGDSLSRAGKPLGLQMGLLDLSTPDAATGTVRRSPQSPFSSSFSHQSVSMSSLQQLSNARANLLLFSSNFLMPERIFFSSPAISYARAILLLFSSDFLTPERIFFSSPAISYARAILLLFSSDFLRQSDSSSLQFSYFKNFFCLHCSWWSG